MENAQSFTYQGQFLDSAGNPLADSNVTLVFSIYNPAKNCLLYEEQQTAINTSGSNGMFSVQVGSVTGSAKRTGNDPGLSMAKVFRNDGTQVTSGGWNLRHWIDRCGNLHRIDCQECCFKLHNQ